MTQNEHSSGKSRLIMGKQFPVINRLLPWMVMLGLISWGHPASAQVRERVLTFPVESSAGTLYLFDTKKTPVIPSAEAIRAGKAAEFKDPLMTLSMKLVAIFATQGRESERPLLVGKAQGRVVLRGDGLPVLWVDQPSDLSPLGKLGGSDLSVICFKYRLDGLASQLPHLRALTGLQRLDMPNNGIKDEDLKALASMKDLRFLDVGANPISDAGLATLVRQHPRLECLQLAGTGITGKGLAELKALPGLRELCLFDTRVDDEGIQQLLSMKTLRLVELPSHVGMGASEALHHAIPDCTLVRAPSIEER